MEQTLDINNRVLVNKLVYDFRDPRRGEIIVFNSPESWRTAPDEKDFIKRVIGVGGDHVVCCDAQRPAHDQRRTRWSSRTWTRWTHRTGRPPRRSRSTSPCPRVGSG